MTIFLMRQQLLRKLDNRGLGATGQQKAPFLIIYVRIMQFIDEAKIYLKAGDGGAGCVSFRREKFIEFGGPDGGDGGKGGDITFIATKDINTLIDFRYKQHFKAQNGLHGMGKQRFGKYGDDIVLYVPLGTQIFAEDGETLLIDLSNDGESIVIAKGGDGGQGNVRFKSSVNQAPRRATPGFPGDELWVWLKLKLLSDVGLVGLPNAGKSTFLSVTTAAKPKIADYPFTTLKPQLGVVSVNDEEFVIADLPGLIEGASQGLGLGDRFLKHIERCKVLLHLIDSSSEDVVHSYDIIRHELLDYKEYLDDKVEIIALTKTDLILEEKIAALSKHTGKKIFSCCAVMQDGVKQILEYLQPIVKS